MVQVLNGRAADRGNREVAYGTPSGGIQKACERHIPNEDELLVRTENLCAASGGCDRCPGMAKAKEVGLVESDPEEVIFCVHGCHLVCQ